MKKKAKVKITLELEVYNNDTDELNTEKAFSEEIRWNLTDLKQKLFADAIEGAWYRGATQIMDLHVTIGHVKLVDKF